MSAVRIVPDLRHELALWRAGLSYVAGLDEVGRGPLAGPVVAAAVVLPPFFEARWLASVRDSKMLTAGRREELAEQIHREALATGIGAASAAEIDRIGLVPATHLAMTSALGMLGVGPDFLLLDATILPGHRLGQCGVIDGDAQVTSIACAAIIAKVERDCLMRRLDSVYPGYGLARHKGYGTAEHLCALDRLGPSPIHRRSFAPVARRLSR
jgi:ribonuclease HII